MMDSDVRAFFMAQDNYEQKINRILQDFVEEQKRKNESGT